MALGNALAGVLLSDRLVRGLEHLRRYYLVALCLLSGALLFWTALRSEGGDWWYSETHADILYTGLHSFHEFPFFSFVFNGGSYFLQDPQGNLFSPAVPLVYLFGPSIGLRLMEGLWGALGVYAFVVWMEKRVSREAAVVGAVASVTSLGVLWKVVIGNDMFLWHLGLPALLWAAEKVIQERNVRAALIFGLVLGFFLLGPTFHSFTYLFLPCVPLLVVFELIRARPSLVALSKIAGLFGAACALALMIASPKLAAWSQFAMVRPINDHGVIGFGNALRGLFDYSLSQRMVVEAINVTPTGENLGGWGLEESAAAMSPLASVLALLGLTSPIWSRPKRPTAIFAVTLIAVGLSLACSWPLWNGFRALTGGNFRVAPRFLGLPAFGLVILVALGADVALSRWKALAIPLTLAAACLLLDSGVWWTLAASRAETARPTAINPFQVASDEAQAARELKGFSTLTKFDPNERAILDGVGYQDGFLVVGNDFKRRLWRSRKRRKAHSPVQLVIGGAAAHQVTISHLGITLQDMPPHTKVRLRARMPSSGLSSEMIPANADVEVRKEGRSIIVVENHGDAPVERVTLRVKWPISGLWFVLSLVAGLGASLALVSMRFVRQRRTAVAVRVG